MWQVTVNGLKLSPSPTSYIPRAQKPQVANSDCPGRHRDHIHRGRKSWAAKSDKLGLTLAQLPRPAQPTSLNLSNLSSGEKGQSPGGLS